MPWKTCHLCGYQWNPGKAGICKHCGKSIGTSGAAPSHSHFANSAWPWHDNAKGEKGWPKGKGKGKGDGKSKRQRFQPNPVAAIQALVGIAGISEEDVAAIKAKAEVAKTAAENKPAQNPEISKSQMEEAKRALAVLSGIPGMDEEVKAIKTRINNEDQANGAKLSGAKLVKFLDAKIAHKERTTADADKLVADYEHRMRELGEMLSEAKLAAAARHEELDALKVKHTEANKQMAATVVAIALAPPGAAAELPNEFTTRPDVAARLKEAQDIVKEVHEQYAAAKAEAEKPSTPGVEIAEIGEIEDTFDQDMDLLVDDLYVPVPESGDGDAEARAENIKRGKAELREKLRNSKIGKHMVRGKNAKSGI